MPFLQSEHIRIVTDLSPCGDYVFQYRNLLFASFLNFFEEIRKCGLRVFSHINLVKPGLTESFRTCLIRFAAATADWSSVISIFRTASYEKIVAGSTATMHADREGILVSDALLPRVFVSYLREGEEHARVQQYHEGACISVSSCIRAVLVPTMHSLNFERCSSPSRRRKALVLSRETRGCTPG